MVPPHICQATVGIEDRGLGMFQGIDQNQSPGPDQAPV